MFRAFLLLALQSALALSSEQWQPISVGLMMQRSYDPTCPSTHDHLMKQSLRQSRRDYKQTVGSIQRMDAGGILLPDEIENGQSQQQHVIMGDRNGTHHHNKREDESFQSIITWYTGSDLLDPSCISEGKWAPTDDSMIAAVTLNWAQKPPCGSFLELRRKKESTITSSSASPTPSASASAKPTKYAESIIVRVMDSCAGCKAGIPHVDLTKAAFKQLYALDIGLATAIEVKLLKNPPFDEWGKQEEMLYGPQYLGGKSKSKASPTGKNEGPDWTSSRDDSWTSKNGSPNWTSDAAPKVLATPTPQNGVGGGSKNSKNGKSGNSQNSSTSSTNGRGRKASEPESTNSAMDGNDTPSDQSGWHNWGGW